MHCGPVLTYEQMLSRQQERWKAYKELADACGVSVEEIWRPEDGPPSLPLINLQTGEALKREPQPVHEVSPKYFQKVLGTQNVPGSTSKSIEDSIHLHTARTWTTTVSGKVP